MSTTTTKNINNAVLGALVDESDTTTANQVVVIGITTATGSAGSTKKGFNSTQRGSLVDESDTTTANQLIFVS